MNCFTVLGIEPTTEKKTIKRAYAAKSREFHPEEHPEEFQRIHDAYEEALAWAERNAGREEEPQMPEEPRRMEMGAAEQEKAAESETWNYAEPERNPEEAYMENPQKEDVQSEESSAQYEELPVHSDEDSEESFREEEAGEPPVQLEEDFQTWDGDWTRQFQNMADASERQGADDREVRKIMEQCISLYLNEKERISCITGRIFWRNRRIENISEQKPLWNPGIIFWIPTGCLMRRSGSIFSGLMENYFQLLKQM